MLLCLEAPLARQHVVGLAPGVPCCSHLVELCGASFESGFVPREFLAADVGRHSAAEDAEEECADQPAEVVAVHIAVDGVALQDAEQLDEED